MAGFFGMFNYAKPGKGVRKDEPEKSRFVHFFELFFRKFWRLIQLNLLYIVCCIPVVTIGPATAGLVYVLRNMSTELPVFLLSDFWDSVKTNWKQSLIYSILMAICALLVYVATNFYSANVELYTWMYLPTALTLFIGLMLILMSFYVMLMIVTLDLPLHAILKNAMILAIICLKTNLLTLLFTGILVLASVLFFPYSLLVFLLLTPALIGFIVCYNSYPGIKKFAIDPYVQAHAAQEPEAGDGPTLFRDEHTSNDS